jgi:hypothetical protein
VADKALAKMVVRQCDIIDPHRFEKSRDHGRQARQSSHYDHRLFIALPRPYPARDWPSARDASSIHETAGNWVMSRSVAGFKVIRLTVIRQQESVSEPDPLTCPPAASAQLAID